MNSYVKRILCALIAAVFAFACVACGGGSDKEESKQNERPLIIEAKKNLFLRKYNSCPLEVKIFI